MLASAEATRRNVPRLTRRQADGVPAKRLRDPCQPVTVPACSKLVRYVHAWINSSLVATATHNHANLYVAGGEGMPSARIINSILSKVALYSGSRIQSNFDTTPQNFDTT
jgi:hypothetical protein